MKLKAIAAALALLAGGQAYAAPISDDNLQANGFTSGTGAGNWFLTVLDTGRNQGFILNLGRNVLADVTTPTNWSLTSTNLKDWIAGGTQSNMFWNISGLSNEDADVAEPFPNEGFLTTHDQQTPSDFIGDGLSGVFGNMSNIGLYLADANTLLGSSDSAIVPNTNLAFPGNPTWGGTLGGGLLFDNREQGFGTTFADSQFVSYVFSPGLGQTDPNIPEATKYLGYANINAATGQVSFTAVPVPAAVWLLGSALLGMVGVSRRRSS